MNSRWFEIYAPLQEFLWNGDSVQLWPGLWVKRLRQKPDLRKLDATLGEDEQDKLLSAQHWLIFRWDEGTDPSPAEIVNLVLLALWLVKPTKTHVAFRFELGQGNAVNQQNRKRLLARFDYIPGVTHREFNDLDLMSAATHFGVLHPLCCARGRLNHALRLTLAGCWSHWWEVALICYAAAVEALLTYDNRRGITNRLATSYACVVEEQQLQRDAAFREFYDLYAARSDIMHGRTHNVSDDDRLAILARFETVVRNIWQKVISTPQLIESLEDTDGGRRKYFLSVQSNYTVPSSPPAPRQLPDLS